MTRRVVITGFGCVTPLGSDAPEVWSKLTEGTSGVGPITLFDAQSLPVRIAAEVPDWDQATFDAKFPSWKAYARQTQLAIFAAVRAGTLAGLPCEAINPMRIGVSLGCGEIFPDFFQFTQSMESAMTEPEFAMAKFLESAQGNFQPTDEFAMDPGAAASAVAALFDAQGPTRNYITACVSSSMAIGEGLYKIRAGDADIIFSGGAHSLIHPFGLTGFHRLSALSERNDNPESASRPFDRHRDGFVVGEGSAILVLEEYEHARLRNAEIFAEVSGYGTTHDAFRVTDPLPDGQAAARCIAMALQDAQLNPNDVGYINAHGSSTVVNDKVETLATKRVFGQEAYRIPISSTKSMTGHLTTACGAVEALFCVNVLRDNIIPPTINFETVDVECDLDYVPNESREKHCQHVVSNSFGFGGQNVSLVFSKA